VHEDAARASLVPAPKRVARLRSTPSPRRSRFGRRAKQSPREGLEGRSTAPVVVRPIPLTARLAQALAADLAGPEVHEYPALAVIHRPNGVEALVTATHPPTHPPCQRPSGARFAAIAQISRTEVSSVPGCFTKRVRWQRSDFKPARHFPSRRITHYGQQAGPVKRPIAGSRAPSPRRERPQHSRLRAPCCSRRWRARPRQGPGLTNGRVSADIAQNARNPARQLRPTRATSQKRTS
jgi:hypothetical protein